MAELAYAVGAWVMIGTVVLFFVPPPVTRARIAVAALCGPVGWVALGMWFERKRAIEKEISQSGEQT